MRYPYSKQMTRQHQRNCRSCYSTKQSLMSFGFEFRYRASRIILSESCYTNEKRSCFRSKIFNLRCQWRKRWVYKLNKPLVFLFFHPPACRARVDLGFIIDGSGSIEHYGKGNFRRCLDFVKAVAQRFNTDNGRTRIGVVLFSFRPRLIFDFKRYRNKGQILRAISRIPYPRGGTKTGRAMRFAYSRLFRYARPGVRKVSTSWLDAICDLILLVLNFAQRGFCIGTPVFPSHETPKFDLT